MSPNDDVYWIISESYGGLKKSAFFIGYKTGTWFITYLKSYKEAVSYRYNMILDEL